MAVKSPPIKTKTLKINEKTKLTLAPGRILRFVSLDVNKVEFNSELMLTVFEEYLIGPHKGRINKTPLFPFIQDNTNLRFTDSINNSFHTNSYSEISVTLNTKNPENSIKSCLLTYTIAIDRQPQQ